MMGEMAFGVVDNFSRPDLARNAILIENNTPNAARMIGIRYVCQSESNSGTVSRESDILGRVLPCHGSTLIILEGRSMFPMNVKVLREMCTFEDF